MTSQEIHILIEQELNTIETFSNQKIEHEEIDLQFNKEYDMYIKEVISNMQVNQNIRGYKKNVREIEVTRLLEKTSEITSLTNVQGYTAKSGELPNDYRNYIRIYVSTTYKCGEENKIKNIKCRVNNDIDIEDILNSPFHKPNEDEFVSLITDNKVEIYYDSKFTINKAYIKFIKNITPIKYTVNSNGEYDSNNSVGFSLSNEVAYDVIERTVIRLGKIIEEDQQKIINLEKELN